jgi:hypothetical protein
MEDSSLGLQNVCCLGISRRDDACGEDKGIHTLHSFGHGGPLAQEAVDSPVILISLVSCQTISYNAFELSNKFIIAVGYLGT